MNSLEFIYYIKDNPNEVIDEPSLKNLFDFISGYSFSFDDELQIIELLFSRCQVNVISKKTFRQFVHENHYEMSLAMGWQTGIELNTANEKEAFYMFYEILDSYLEKENPVLSRDGCQRKRTKEAFGTWFIDILKTPAIYVGQVSLKRIYYFFKGYLYKNDIEIALDFYNFLITKFGKTEMLYYEYLLSIFQSDEIAIEKVKSAWEEFIN